MRIDSTLDITPEESQIEHSIQATLRKNVDQTKSQQTHVTSEQGDGLPAFCSCIGLGCRDL